MDKNFNKIEVVSLDNTKYIMNFKKPTTFDYTHAIIALNKNDYYGAFDFMFNALATDTKYKENDEIKALFFNEFYENYFKFIELEEFYSDENGLYKVTINKKTVKFKKPDRKVYKEIFNERIGNPIGALDIIFEKLLLPEFADIDLTVMEYVSLKDIPTALLFNKQIELKKK